MPGQTKRKYWDANCFLNYVNGAELYLPTLESILEESSSGAIKVVTSTLSIVEVAFGAAEQKAGSLSRDVEERINALWQDIATVQLVEFFDRIAYKARELIRSGVEQGWSLKPPDAIHLATAVIIDAEEFHTYDPALRKYSPLIGMPVVEPYSPQPRLPL